MAEVDGVMFDKHAGFLEAAGIEQHVEPLSRGQLALGVLRVDALLPAAHARGLALLLQLFDDVLHGLGVSRLRDCRSVPSRADRAVSPWHACVSRREFHDDAARAADVAARQPLIGVPRGGKAGDNVDIRMAGGEAG